MSLEKLPQWHKMPYDTKCNNLCRVSKSNWLHVVIFGISFLPWGIDSSEMVGDYPEVLNFKPVISQTKPVHM